MAYEQTGLMSLFPVYLARYADKEIKQDDYDVAVAGNELNLNQNFEILFQKLQEIEAYLSQQEE